MTAVKYYHSIAVFQHRHAVDCLHSSSVCDTVQVDDTRKVNRHHASRIVIVIATKRLSQGTVVTLICAVKRNILFRDLIHPRRDLLVQTVVKVQVVNLNVLSNASRYTGSVGGFYWGGNHLRKNGS